MELQIDKEFKNLIPVLSGEEYAQLEDNIISDGCRDPLVIWQNYIIDGHNRYEICTKHNITFNVFEKYFDTKDEVLEWIILNQFGRRNLSSYTRGVLALKLEDFYKTKGRENLIITGKNVSSINQGLPMLAKVETAIDTRKEISIISGVSHGNIDKIKKIESEASADVKEQLHKGEITINRAYTAIVADESRKRNEEIKKINPEKYAGIYDVIVIDPPWEMEKIKREVAPNQGGFDYSTMNIEEIGAIELPTADNCHLFCWTTHKHLPDTFNIIEAWGFKYVCLFTWHKNGGFQPWNLPQYNSEFVLYCRKGSPVFSETKAFNTCFEGKRREHSRKPDEFYEVIERVTEGQSKIDIFSREKREGWAQFGNEVEKFSV